MKIFKISATSRAAVKVGSDFFTFEYSEERLIEDGDDIDEVRAQLWETCHSQVDDQIEDITTK